MDRGVAKRATGAGRNGAEPGAETVMEGRQCRLISALAFAIEYL